MWCQSLAGSLTQLDEGDLHGISIYYRIQAEREMKLAQLIPQSFLLATQNCNTHLLSGTKHSTDLSWTCLCWYCLLSTHVWFQQIQLQFSSGNPRNALWGNSICEQHWSNSCLDTSIFHFLKTMFYNLQWTARSAKPFVEGWYGAEVICLIPFCCR